MCVIWYFDRHQLKQHNNWQCVIHEVEETSIIGIAMLPFPICSLTYQNFTGTFSEIYFCQIIYILSCLFSSAWNIAVFNTCLWLIVNEANMQKGVISLMHTYFIVYIYIYIYIYIHTYITIPTLSNNNVCIPIKSGQMSDVLQHMFVLMHAMYGLTLPSPVAQAVHVSQLSHSWGALLGLLYVTLQDMHTVFTVFVLLFLWKVNCHLPFRIPLLALQLSNRFAQWNKTKWYFKLSKPTTLSLWHNHSNAFEAALNYLLQQLT